MNSSLKYDSSRLDEMQYFLSYMLSLSKNNPELYISSDIIYNELKNWNLKQSDRDNCNRPSKVDHLFAGWKSDFKNVQNINVFQSPDFMYWCQFTNNPHSDEFIKMYVPIDREHLHDGVEKLFGFLARNNISHESKVGTHVRSDNVIIRLSKGDTQSLRKIIDFINHDKYLKDGLNKPNPFLPCIDGIGVMNETGISYNDEMSKLIANYIRRHKNDSRIDINNFIEESKKLMYKKEVKDTFEISTSRSEQYFERGPKVNYEQNLSTIQKQILLSDAIRATLNKYGIYQAQGALMQAINNSSFECFTNGTEGYRDLLKKHVSSSEIIGLIKNVFPNAKSSNMADTEYLVNSYVNLVCGTQLNQMFDSMCEVTLDNHGKQFLIRSIKQYYQSGNSTCFSRFKKDSDDKRNYRDYCKYFNKNNMLQIMCTTLQLKGQQVDYSKIDDIVSVYVTTLQQSNYKKAI